MDADHTKSKLEDLLATRAAANEAAEHSAEEFTAFMEEDPRYDDKEYLVKLLLGFVDRIGTDLDMGNWESPTAEDHGQACLEMVDLCNRAWGAVAHHGLTPSA